MMNMLCYNAKSQSVSALLASLTNTRISRMADIQHKEIITRKQAIEKGLIRYFTGKPCPHGHIEERTTSSSQCLGCGRLNPTSKYKYPERYKKYRKNPKNALKIRVHEIVYHAVKKGILTRKPCEVCGELKVEAHHDDYSKILDV